MNATAANERRNRPAAGGNHSPGVLVDRNMPAGAGVHGGNVFHAAREWGCDWRQILDFSASINPLGVSPKVREALANSIDRIAHYPETGCAALREAVAGAWDVEPAQGMSGNGATELLYFLLRVLRPKKAHLVLPTFSEYTKALAGSDLTFTACDADTYAISWNRLAADVDRALPDWLVLTNPNNPTGAAFDPKQFLRWFDHQRPRMTTVVLDESFVDFVPRLSAVGATRRRRNLLVLRSLTKFHAMPGLRLGCLIGHPEQIADLERTREPWQVNAMAEQAALAALSDADYQRQTVDLVAKERKWLRQALARLPGVRPLPSAANYIFVECERPVDEMQRFLRGHRILIRDCTAMAGVRGRAFRVAVRTRSQNQTLVAALKQFFEGQP